MEDQLALQRDLDRLKAWGDRWGMRFNAGKCNVMRISRSRDPLTRFYSLGGQVLLEVDNAKYLGITITNELSWSTHTAITVSKAGRTLGFLRRNLKSCPQALKETSYISLVRSILEYGSTVWDPHLAKDINSLEKIQRKAARFIKRDYKSDSSVTAMLQELGLNSLADRRRDLRLALLYKVAHCKVKVPADTLGLIKPTRPNRKNHKFKYRTLFATTNELKFSAINRTIPDWNDLPASVAEAPSVDSFKTQLSKLPRQGHSD